MGSHPENQLIIRADGSARTGTGHVMRCLALAKGWQRAGRAVTFALAEVTPALEQRLANATIPYSRMRTIPGTTDDADQTIRLATQCQAAWIVADGYQFGTDYQRRLKAAGLNLLLVDDYGHAGHYHADLVLNQNLHAHENLYAHREPHTHLLLGTQYVLLREQFLKWRDWQREIPDTGRKVLVTLGGADPDNMTAKVMEALRRLDVETNVVVGGSNPHFAGDSSVLRDVSNMPELMAWADVAVSAGGTTSWELAFMGLPSLVLMLADNQRLVAESLNKAQIAKLTTADRLATDLTAFITDAEALRLMSERGRQLVDGQGVSRVVTLLQASALALRRATSKDCRQVWQWANDPEARAVSFSPDPIPWETHLQWFNRRIASPSCLFYIATNSHAAPVGQIRYDINGKEAVVSVALSREKRGHGYGAALIIRGSEQCFIDSDAQIIRAHIKPGNEASVRAFQRAGYRDTGIVEVDGQPARQFVLVRL